MLILPRQSLFPYRSSGAILFVALWTLVILVILSMGITSRVSSEIRFTKYLKERAIPLYLAKAAVNRAILELEKDKTPDYDALYELRKVREIELGNGSFTFSLIDEESRLNINTAAQDIISRLPGLSPELADKIIQSRPFLLKEELLLIDGLTYDITYQVKDLITVYGEGKININTGSPEILKIAGLDEGIIDTILAYRKGADGQEMTEDDGVYALLPAEVSPNLFRLSSKNLKVDIYTKILNQASGHYSAILERPTAKIKFWQEK